MIIDRGKNSRLAWVFSLIVVFAHSGCEERLNADVRPLAPHQEWLLERAFEAASALPIDPHVKTRSRLQETVALAALELGQPKKAIVYADKIEDWRKGSVWTEYARFQARSGFQREALDWLGRAGEIAEGAGRSSAAQEWRRDRIRAGIASVFVLLGKHADAERWSEGLVDSEAKVVALARAEAAGAAETGEQIAWARRLIENGGFEQVGAALSILGVLFVRNLNVPEVVQTVEGLIEAGSRKMPVTRQIDGRLELAARLTMRGAMGAAIGQLERAEAILASEPLIPESRIPILTRLAAAWAGAGEREAARAKVGAAAREYEEARGRIVDIFRARTLRPIAETVYLLGEVESALEIYGRALEEGAANPNSRPRAEDLVATCLSMAVRGIEPDQALSKRIDEIGRGLGDPW